MATPASRSARPPCARRSSSTPPAPRACSVRDVWTALGVRGAAQSLPGARLAASPGAAPPGAWRARSGAASPLGALLAATLSWKGPGCSCGAREARSRPGRDGAPWRASRRPGGGDPVPAALARRGTAGRPPVPGPAAAAAALPPPASGAARLAAQGRRPRAKRRRLAAAPAEACAPGAPARALEAARSTRRVACAPARRPGPRHPGCGLLGPRRWSLGEPPPWRRRARAAPESRSLPQPGRRDALLGAGRRPVAQSERPRAGGGRRLSGAPQGAGWRLPEASPRGWTSRIGRTLLPGARTRTVGSRVVERR